MTNNAQENEMIDFDLNDLPDLPAFVVWPAGSYNVEGVSLSKIDLNFGQEVIPAIELKVKLVKANEVKPATAEPPAEGSEFSWNYPLVADTEEATQKRLGALKRILAPIGQAFGTSSVPEIAAKFPGSSMLITTSVYVKKGDKLAGEDDRIYSNLKSLIMI